MSRYNYYEDGETRREQIKDFLLETIPKDKKTNVEFNRTKLLLKSGKRKEAYANFKENVIGRLRKLYDNEERPDLVVGYIIEKTLLKEGDKILPDLFNRTFKLNLDKTKKGDIRKNIQKELGEDFTVSDLLKQKQRVKENVRYGITKENKRERVRIEPFFNYQTGKPEFRYVSLETGKFIKPSKALQEENKKRGW